MSQASGRRDPEQPPGSPGPRFEEALAELERIARDLEDGTLGLEESLVRYEAGVKLLRQCHVLLASAERRIELLAGVDANGNPVTRPFEIPDNGITEARASAAAPETTVPLPTRGPEAAETRNKPAARRQDERPAPRPKRPTRPGEIDESRELF